MNDSRVGKLATLWVNNKKTYKGCPEHQAQSEMEGKPRRGSNVRVCSYCRRGLLDVGVVAMRREPTSLRPITKVLHHRRSWDVTIQLAMIGVHLARLWRRIIGQEMRKKRTSRSFQADGSGPNDTITKTVPLTAYQRSRPVASFVQLGVAEVELEREWPDLGRECCRSRSPWSLSLSRSWSRSLSPSRSSYR